MAHPYIRLPCFYFNHIPVRETLEHNLFYAFAINAEVPHDNEGQRKYTGSN